MNISSYIPQIQLIFTVILVLFTIGATILTFITISNVFRLRNVIITWKAGRLKGYPLFATLFLFFSATLFGLSIYYRRFDHLAIFACYGWAGINWFVSSFLMSKRYITDHGIVKNINDPSQTVAWHRIIDFVERENETFCHYTFFYALDDELTGLTRSIRLELNVPKENQPVFRKILSYKLGRRFNQDYEPVRGYEQLN